MQTTDLAASAREIMAANPASGGWQRLEARGCGGKHPAAPHHGTGPLIYWRRNRDLFDEATGGLLDAADDPQLWVAEQVPIALCASERFYYNNTHPAVRAVMNIPWSFSGPPKSGSTVKLECANGTWVWVVQPDAGRRCCGHLAVWRD